MISHKESAVGKCESLIGVTNQEYLMVSATEGDEKDLGQREYITAATFSLDLRQYNAWLKGLKTIAWKQSIVKHLTSASNSYK